MIRHWVIFAFLDAVGFTFSSFLQRDTPQGTQSCQVNRLGSGQSNSPQIQAHSLDSRLIDRKHVKYLISRRFSIQPNSTWWQGNTSIKLSKMCQKCFGSLHTLKSLISWQTITFYTNTTRPSQTLHSAHAVNGPLELPGKCFAA